MWYGAEPGTTNNVLELLKLDTEEELLRYFDVDFRTIRPRYIGPELKTYDDGTFETMWGIKRGGGFWGMALNHPLAEVHSVAELKEYHFPQTEWFDTRFTQEDEELSRQYAIIGGMWAPFWHDAIDLFSIEKMFVELYTNPVLIMEVVDRCFQLHYEVTRKCFEENSDHIDVFFFANDYGTSNCLIIDPDLWRKYFKPYQKKLADLGHQYGIHVAMHSCGDIHQIIPDLIEIGVEILNPIQVSVPNMDPAILKREYGKDLVFFGAIDYNQLLNFGTPEEVRAGVRSMIDILGNDGRYIVAPSHDLMMEEVPPENIVALYDEALRYSGKYATAV
jgi:uroporphyrinogen decarboxylase